MNTAEGRVEPGFESVQDLLLTNVTSGEEVGASIYVDIGGKPVVDIWAGFVNEDRTQPWTKNTITVVWSTSKTITNLAALVLVERGLLNVNERVSKYWPEFSANGKENILIRHILGHTSGLSGWESPITIEEIYDVRGATKRLEKQAPWWEPGTASGYHAITQGYLVGELVRRVTGKSLTKFIAEEIADRIGADYQLGLVEKDWSRASDIFSPPTPLPIPDPDDDSIASKTFRSAPLLAHFANEPPLRHAEMGGSNGFGNARSVGRIMSVVSLGGVINGHRLLSQKTIDLIFLEQASGTDLVLGGLHRFGVGFGLPTSNTLKGVSADRACYWSGWGGSIVLMDLDRRMTFSYVMNKMGDEITSTKRMEGYLAAVYAALDQSADHKAS